MLSNGSFLLICTCQRKSSFRRLGSRAKESFDLLLVMDHEDNLCRVSTSKFSTVWPVAISISRVRSTPTIAATLYQQMVIVVSLRSSYTNFRLYPNKTQEATAKHTAPRSYTAHGLELAIVVLPVTELELYVKMVLLKLQPMVAFKILLTTLGKYLMKCLQISLTKLEMTASQRWTSSFQKSVSITDLG